MADRFPLIVNAVSQKIEELVSGDNLDLSGNNIVISGDTGSGKYLTSNGTVVSWGSPGDVYLNQSQEIRDSSKLFAFFLTLTMLVIGLSFFIQGVKFIKFSKN